MPRFRFLLLLVAAAPTKAPAQNFGSAVAATGREIFIGEPLNSYSPGFVHVYQRGANGVWKVVSQLKAANGTNFDRFGRSLSADGDRLLVGSTSIDSSRGAGYIFDRDRTGTWRQSAKLAPVGAKPDDSWGRLALLQGDVAYLTSWGANESKGAVSIWNRRSNGQWTETGVISASDGAPGDFFGGPVAVTGDLMVVGAAQRDSAKGAAYVFRRDGAGQWKEEAKLLGRGLTRFGRFGTAVAIDGQTLLIGAPGADGGMGAVFGYRRENNQWTEQARMAPFDGIPQAQFGTTLLALAGDVWIGAPGADKAGRIYRLAKAAEGGFSNMSKLAQKDTEQGDQFGGALAAAGTAVVVGLPGDDNGAGTAFILDKGTGAWTGGSKVWSEENGLAGMTGTKRDCGTSKKVGDFGCSDVDLMAFLPIKDIGGGRGVQLNDVWGWTDPETSREYALVGRIDGTSFVDITDPVRPRYLGDLHKTEGSPSGAWRDIKVYKNHAYVVADGSDRHGMQVFDLTRLRKVRTPEQFKPDFLYDQVASVHNIVIDTLSGYAFAVGANGGGETCGGALHMIDIREPKAPRFAGCFADKSTGNQRTGYTHDSQCTVYHGPDTTYTGRQICFNSSETAIGIADITDKANPKALSRAAYPNVGYTHQGWLTDDQRFFYVDDEGDEIQGTVKGTRTLIWDVSDLDDPILANEYISANRASDHNLYIKGDLMYQSNYASGLRIFDISDRKNPKPVGHFDTVPIGEDEPGFTGSWSNYPYFKSGTLVVTSISEGLFLVKKSEKTLIP